MNEKATILVVEDNRATQEGILSFLRDEGYLAVGAENGKRALELDKMGPPSLILLDLMMPVMDGWQFLAQWRAAERSGCPVVLLSGLPYIQDAPGVADFLSKPIRFEKLRACLERYCASSSARG